MKKSNSNFGFIKVAAISPKCEVASPEANVKNALPDIFRVVHENHAQVVVLPELCISSYTCEDLFNNSRLITACREQLVRLAEETALTSAVIVVGVPLLNRQRLFNCAAVIQKGEILGVVPKMYLASHGEFNEKRWFSDGAGSDLTDIVIDGKTVPFGNLLFRLSPEAVLGVEICEDLWVPVQESSILALNGANIIANPSASPELVGKHKYRTDLITAQSARCNCGYVTANAGIGESSTNLVFSGSCVIAENGSMLAKGERFKESSVVFADIDVQLLNTSRRSSSFFDNAKDYRHDYKEIPAFVPELSQEHINREYSPTPFLPDGAKMLEERCVDIFSLQTAALVKRLSSGGYTKVVIPYRCNLSAALALMITLNALNELGLPTENAICVTDADPSELAIIRMFIDSLSVRPTLKAITEMSEKPEHERERAFLFTTMNITEKNSALILGTDSMTKIALYMDKYIGPGLGMYSINASVPISILKHIVLYAAGAGIGAKPEQIEKYIEVCTSKGLFYNSSQSVPYDVADFLLYHFVSSCFSSEKIMFIAQKAFNGKYTREDLTGYIIEFNKLFFATQSIRSSLPDNPAIGSVSVSQSCTWRMPSDADNEIFNQFTTYDTIRRVPRIQL